MAPLLFVLLLVVPIAELWVIVQVADAVGILETLALLILVSAAGAVLLKQQGTATWARLRRNIARGEIPTEEVTDGALILMGGAFLLTPGFLTDAIGILLLLPPSRAVVKRSFRRLLARWAKRRWGIDPRRPYRRAEVVRVERRDASPTSAEPDAPRSRLPDGGDSRDRG